MRGPLVLVTTLLTSAAFVAVVVVACSPSYPICYRGEYQGCFCANATPGYQACAETENAFLACVCDGTTPGIDGGRDAASSAADAASADTGAGSFMRSCGPNDFCDFPGAICFAFGNKGKVCTRKCTQPTDCPAPSKGCSANQGICSAP